MRPSTRTVILALPFLVLAACGGESTSPLTDGTPAERTASETSAPTP
ncbi:MAG: hypothetical protein KY457_01895 [Actinobacteria bacterium]|nr:hypothetical protein [Actinomycetota bacterium]